MPLHSKPHLATFATLLLLGSLASRGQVASTPGQWMPLFDGKTLTGWEGNTKVFRVEEGAVVAGSMEAQIPRNEFLCTTKDYADFELLLDFKLTGPKGKANAGIQVRSRRIPDHHEMIGYQADIGQHYWGSIYDEQRRRKIVAQADLAALRPKLNEDGWNTYRIRCEGRRVRLWINDLQTVDYIEPDETLEQAGVIGLQIHSGPPCEVRYRNIRLRELAGGIPFRAVTINAESPYEAAGILDVNKDGKMDVFCGGQWYEAPDWKPHKARDVKAQNGYHNDFANLVMDVDGDGWDDVINATWFSKSVFWARNPGKPDAPFEVVQIDAPGNMETAVFCDMNADGMPDLLPNAVRASVWYERVKDAAGPHGVRWQRHDIIKQASGHGNGGGDLNGDGLADVVVRKGWAEQTGNAEQRWIWHAEFDLGDRPSIPILVHDVDSDGDADIIWGKAHNFGVHWLEQGEDDAGERTWTQHDIDTEWSQAHYLLLADLDEDGEVELVTGKRVRAHNGKDPGGTDPPSVYYYRFDRAEKTWARYPLSEKGSIGFGINTMVGDIDADGDIDIVAPGKSGLYLFVNELR